MQQHFSVTVGTKKIRGVLHLPHAFCEGIPCVICCHGLFSSKDSPKFISLAERFSNNLIAVIRFDFSGCGKSDGNIADTTVTNRLKELEQIYGFALKHPGLGGKIGLLGSSIGGFISLFFASAHPRVKALSVWASPYDLEETGKNIPPENLKILKYIFFTDAAKYDLAAVLGKITAVQVIQGMKDTTVPWRHAEEIFSCLCDPKQLEIFPDGDHAITDPGDRDRAITMALEWFKRFLL